MKKILPRLPALLTGRVARNIYFWIFILQFRLDFSNTRVQTFFILVLYALLMGMSYINNLVLAPRLLGKRKNWTYLILAAALCTVTAFCYVLTLKLMLHYYPQYTVFSVSVIAGPKNTPDLSVAAIFREMTTYFSACVSWTAFFTMAWYVMNYTRSQKLMEEARKKQTETELQFLKGQINPHFLFNTLNNLYGLSIKKSDDAPDAILKLSSILRYLIYESNAASVAFSKEKEVMLAYIDLELLRLSPNDRFSFIISADAPCSIPPLLWLPILENVFKHGTRFTNDDYMIEFVFRIKNDVLTIYSKNNYNANHTNGLENNKGIGLVNLKQRLEILYPGKYKMEASHDDTYYIAVVEINLK